MIGLPLTKKYSNGVKNKMLLQHPKARANDGDGTK